MKLFPNVLQGSEAWDNLRRCRPTASRFDRIFTAVKADISKSAADYALEIVTQQLFASNPDPPKFIGNAYTDQGLEREAEARAAVAKAIACEIHEVGFAVEDQGFYGCSPDGLIKDGHGEWVSGVELKCPTSAVHMRYLLDGRLPGQYVQQVWGSMAVTGLRRWLFASYFPGLPLVLVNVVWDDTYGGRVTKAMDDFRILYASTRLAASFAITKSNASQFTL